MRIKKVFGQDKKGTRPLTPRDKSGLLAMTWWRESMREGSRRTGFRPNRARSQRVQSNNVTSLRALERNGRAKENEIWNKNMLWECEIGGRGVRSRTTAGASSSDSWTNQMGRPKPGADIEIGNQRRTPAIRRRQTEAEEQKMQHNKGRTKGLREGRSESIRMETGRRGKREIFEPEHISNLLSGLCTSSGVACYFQSEKEDWAMQRRKKLSPLLW